MPAGLQVFDRFGNLRVDLGDRLLRFLGTTVIGASASGSIVHDGFLTGTPFCFCTMHTNDSPATWGGEGLLPPDISFSGNTMYYTSYVAASQRLQYGVY